MIYGPDHPDHPVQQTLRERLSAEPELPVPPPQGPGFEERDLPTCPACKGLVRRNLSAKEHGSVTWRCDLHGEVTPVWERYEIPTGYDEED